MLTAVKTGLRGKDILYTNNSKTPEEIATALDIGAFINADSPPDLRMIQKEAEKKNKTAKISFRINPDINPKTHPKIATGLRETKFGVHIDKDDAFNAYKAAKTMNHIKISGVHTHIGSQITETSPYIEAAEKIMEFTYRLKKELGIELQYIDLGGGLGIPYTEENTAGPEDLAEAVVPVIKKWNKRLGYEPELWLEPGRYIVADAGIMLTEARTIKETPYKKFINTDAGFNVLIRPVMYDAYHRIEILGKEKNPKTENTTSQATYANQETCLQKTGCSRRQRQETY